jgi:hypothetical protein
MTCVLPFVPPDGSSMRTLTTAASRISVLPLRSYLSPARYYCCYDLWFTLDLIVYTTIPSWLRWRRLPDVR